jgi:hypothetical protein
MDRPAEAGRKRLGGVGDALAIMLSVSISGCRWLESMAASHAVAGKRSLARFDSRRLDLGVGIPQ